MSETPHDPPIRTHLEGIARVQRDLPAVGKDSQTAAQGRYSYRSIDGLINALHPLLARHGVVIAPIAQEWLTDDLSRMLVRVTYEISCGFVEDPATAGDPVRIQGLGVGAGNDDKNPGKALSYAYKSAISQLFSVPTEDPAMDPDSRDPGVDMAAPVDSWRGWGGWDSQDEHDRDRAQLLDESKALSEGAKKLLRERLIDLKVIDRGGRWAERVTLAQANGWDEALSDVKRMMESEPFEIEEEIS